MTGINRPIVVHGLDDARAALAAAAGIGCPVTLVSAPGAAAHAGAAWFGEVVALAAAGQPGVTVTAVLDCAGQPGLALAALRAGIRHVHCADAHPQALARLADIAAASGAVLETGGIGPALNLRGCRDPVAACRDWLLGANAAPAIANRPPLG